LFQQFYCSWPHFYDNRQTGKTESLPYSQDEQMHEARGRQLLYAVTQKFLSGD